MQGFFDCGPIGHLDPRPLDPPETFEDQMPNIASWIVVQKKYTYDSQAKKFTHKISRENGEGDVGDFLQVVAKIHSNIYPGQFEIFVDATLICPRPSGVKSACYQLDYSQDNDVYWEIKQADVTEESGTDSDELFGLVEYMMEKNEEFSIEFGDIDPTPQYLYDNSGGEAPVTMQEICNAAFVQKRELRG